jgi:hypothetical protein
LYIELRSDNPHAGLALSRILYGEGRFSSKVTRSIAANAAASKHPAIIPQRKILNQRETKGGDQYTRAAPVVKQAKGFLLLRHVPALARACAVTLIPPNMAEATLAIP